jgi:REP element-mobilizing transposase RayT
MLYHVTARGNNKQRIYLDTSDFERFLSLLENDLERFGVQCLAYCLMHTHYHLLLKVGPHPVSRLMQHLNSGYCQQFNRRHERVGHVLQGRFGSRLVEDGFYARLALRYLALNPVQARLVSAPEQWPWSSYAESMRPATTGFLSLQDVWAIFGAADEGTGRALFAELVAAPWLDEYMNRGLLLGSRELARFVGSLVAPHRGDVELLRRERFACRPSLAEIFSNVKDEADRHRAARLAHLHHGYTLKEIAAIFACHPTTIGRWVRRSPC